MLNNLAYKDIFCGAHKKLNTLIYSYTYIGACSSSVKTSVVAVFVRNIKKVTHLVPHNGVLFY